MATDILTNEPNVIAAIRADMARQEKIASQHANNHSLQWETLSGDMRAAAQGGIFTSLEEKQAHLDEEFALLRAGIIAQKHHYDVYCEQRSLAYSSNWNALLAELDRGGYLLTPMALSGTLAVRALRANK